MYTIYTTETFEFWFSRLKDKQVRIRIQARIDRVEDGHFGDHKSVGDGVSELRFFFGSGYRVYYCQRGTQIIILLAGGDKSSQDADIKLAIELAKNL
ncbi:MAG: type II toxin-antitoxin system RelE/ParE family toxin [Gammaproteobacteria bacterium]|nr:type II toxin-antitoxin system RelE/ParE family toxin [Gammaproteobacteria bacterium]